jgi:hypothetical protein
MDRKTAPTPWTIPPVTDAIEARHAVKATLASVLAKAASGLRLNEHIEHEDGATVFRHACKMGLEGIVSSRRRRKRGLQPPAAVRLISAGP